MTQEDKQLLIKDLCARLPYSVWGLHRGEDLPLYVIDSSGAYMVLGYNAWFNLDTVNFKPYLRPMSSITEKEMDELNRYVGGDRFVFANGVISADENFYHEGHLYSDHEDYVDIIDWLNAHHFDYRGLIEKELAIEVIEENNPYK